MKEDFIAPTVSITPDSSNVPLDAIIHFSFSKPVRNKDGTELNYESVDDLLIVKKDNESGEDVDFNANINSTKDHIEVKFSNALDPGQKYYVSFKDEFEGYSGNKLVVTNVSFTTWSPLPVKEISDEIPVNIFPNPTSGFFILEVDYEGLKNLEIYSATGKLILTKINIWDKRIFVNMIDQRAGLYLVVLRSEDNRILSSQKLFVSY